MRKKSVRQKLNAIGMEFKGKNVMLVDDSIVRGTTSREIVQMARDAGARKVYLRVRGAAGALSQRLRHRHAEPRASSSPPAAPTSEIAREIGADRLIYQDLDALIDDVRSVNPKIEHFETSCFNGVYVTGDITPEYLADVEAQRNDGELSLREANVTQLDLNLATAE